MSSQHFDEGSIRKYTLSAFLGFVAVFCLLMLMMQCHGDFKPVGKNENAPATVAGEKLEAAPAAAEK